MITKCKAQRNYTIVELNWSKIMMFSLFFTVDVFPGISSGNKIGNVPLTFPYPTKLHSFNELHFYAHSIEKN